MVEWHRPNLDPEDIARIIREGREENDKKFDSYLEYIGYIGKDNDRILNEYDQSYSENEPNKLTKEELEEFANFEVEKNAMIDYQEVLDELRRDREERDDILDSLMLETFKDNKHILDAIGSDYDENGIAYWEKWKKDGGREEDNDN